MGRLQSCRRLSRPEGRVHPIAVPEDQRSCSICGDEKHCIGHDDTEVIDILPAEVIVRVDRREKLSCDNGCEGQVVRAPQGVAAASTNLEPDRRGLRSIDKGRAAARTSLHWQGHRRRANGRQGAGGLPLGSLDRPRVQRFGNATVLTIPIQGTTDGVQHYEMTEPPGPVVKLPHATARLPLDDYRINQGGFGVVWVRHSAEGLHLRFHFTAKRLQHTLTLGSDRVAVTLSPGA